METSVFDWTSAITTTINASTPEQREQIRCERERQQRMYQEQMRSRAELQRLASGRARVLLLSLLDDVQAAEYEAHGQFHVIGSVSGNRYLIMRGRAQNVFRLNDAGERVVELCGHVGECVPDEDNILAQKFMIETDEAEFLRVANATRLMAERVA